MAQLLMMLLFLLALAPMHIPLLAQAAKPPASPVPRPVRPAPIPAYSIDFDLSTEIHENLYTKLSSLLRRTSVPPYAPPRCQWYIYIYIYIYVLGKRRAKFDGTASQISGS
jgi:hypothetical protein